MSVITKSKIKSKQKRWQITFTKETDFDKVIYDLEQEYEGMSLSEITKLALIKLRKAKFASHSNAAISNTFTNQWQSNLTKAQEIGAKAFKEWGLNTDDATEVEVYDFFKNLK